MIHTIDRRHPMTRSPARIVLSTFAGVIAGAMLLFAVPAADPAPSLGAAGQQTRPGFTATGCTLTLETSGQDLAYRVLHPSPSSGVVTGGNAETWDLPHGVKYQAVADSSRDKVDAWPDRDVDHYIDGVGDCPPEDTTTTSSTTTTTLATTTTTEPTTTTQPPTTTTVPPVPELTPDFAPEPEPPAGNVISYCDGLDVATWGDGGDWQLYITTDDLEGYATYEWQGTTSGFVLVAPADVYTVLLYDLSTDTVHVDGEVTRDSAGCDPTPVVEDVPADVTVTEDLPISEGG